MKGNICVKVVEILLFQIPFISYSYCLYNPSSQVSVLSSEQFKRNVKNGHNVWLVEFFAPWCGHCKKFAPEYIKVAKALKGLVNVGAIEDTSVMKDEGISGFPTIKLYIGGSKPIVKTYANQRNSQSIINFVFDTLRAIANERVASKASSTNKKTSLIELTTANFENLVLKDTESVWFIKAYAPWCGHCKALKGPWQQLASSVKAPIKIGRLDATKHTEIASQLNIAGYPTLILFPMGKKSYSTFVNYEGAREFTEMKTFVTSYVIKVSPVTQLLSNEQFLQTCQKKVCLISFLPHILDSKVAGRQKYLKELQSIAQKMALTPVNFLWVQGGDNFDLEESLQMSFGYPALIAIHLEKRKVAIHRGNFNSDSIQGFLSGLMTGKQSLKNLPKSLIPFSTVPLWNATNVIEKVEKIRNEEL